MPVIGDGGRKIVSCDHLGQVTTDHLFPGCLKYRSSISSGQDEAALRISEQFYNLGQPLFKPSAMAKIGCDGHSAGKQATEEGRYEVGPRLVQQQHLLSGRATGGLQSGSNSPSLLVQGETGKAVKAFVFDRLFAQKQISDLLPLSCGSVPYDLYEAPPFRLATPLGGNPKRLLQLFRHEPPAFREAHRRRQSRVQACSGQNRVSVQLAAPNSRFQACWNRRQPS